MKRLLFQSVALLSLCALVIAAGCTGEQSSAEHAQGSIEGQVILQDADDYSDVTVRVGDESTTTDADGDYALHWLSAGETEITADHPEYVAETRRGDVVAGDIVTVDFELELDDRRPTIDDVVIEPAVLVPDEVASIGVEVDNPDEVSLDYSYEATGGFDVQNIDGDSAELIAPGEFGITGELTVAISDDDGVTDERTIDIETREHGDPTIDSISAVPEQFQPGETGTLEAHASSPHDDELFYDWNAPDGWSVDPVDEPTADVTAPSTPEVQAEIELVVTDELGGEASDIVEVSTRDNNPPEITELSADPPQVEPGGEIDLIAQAHDPDGDDIDYNWSAPSDWTLTDVDAGNATLIAPDEYESTAHITLEVTDEYGAQTSAELVVSTITAQGPQLTQISADPMQVDRGGTIDLEATASHPEGAALDYDWSAPDGWNLVEDASQPATPALLSPDAPGQTATVEVTVTDPQGLEAIGSVVVSTFENALPVIEALDADPAAVVPGDSTIISAEVYDPDGEDLSYDWDVPDDWSGTSDDETIELVAPDDYSQSATVSLTVDDGYDSTSATVSVSTVPNLDPTISSFTADPYVVEREATSHLVVDATDPYGDALTYSWQVDNADWTLDVTDDEATLQAPDTPDDLVEVTVTVEDDFGGSSQASLTVQTATNSAPTISSFTADPYVVERQASSDLVVDASDPDGGALTYSWEVDNSDWILDTTDDEATLHAPDAYGDMVTTTVTVEDDQGATTTASLTVQTEENTDPIILDFSADPEVVDRSADAELEVDAIDPNGEPLNYAWSTSGTNAGQWDLVESGETATLTAPDLPDDTIEVTVVVDDGYGGSADATLTVVSEPNNAPVIEQFHLDSDDVDNEWVSRGGDAELTVDVTNDDGDSLTYD